MKEDSESQCSPCIVALAKQRRSRERQWSPHGQVTSPLVCDMESQDVRRSSIEPCVVGASRGDPVRQLPCCRTGSFCLELCCHRGCSDTAGRAAAESCVEETERADAADGRVDVADGDVEGWRAGGDADEERPGEGRAGGDVDVERVGGDAGVTDRRDGEDIVARAGATRNGLPRRLPR